MKTKIEKLHNILKIVEPVEEKRVVELVYLSIVHLGFTIDQVSTYFNLSYNKVRYALTLLGLKLNKDASFRLKMKKAVQVYNVDLNLKLVA